MPYYIPNSGWYPGYVTEQDRSQEGHPDIKFDLGPFTIEELKELTKFIYKQRDWITKRGSPWRTMILDSVVSFILPP